MSAELRVVTDPATERAARTVQLLSAQVVVYDLIFDRDLDADRLEYHLQITSAWRFTGERRRHPYPVGVSVSLFRNPTGFLAWCDALDVAAVAVHRRDNDTTLNAFNDHRDVDFSIAGSIPRPASGEHLPGIPAPWKRLRSGRLGHEGVTTVDELRAVLHHLNGETA